MSHTGNSLYERKDIPSLKGPYGGADACFIILKMDTSHSCKTTDTWAVHRMVCFYSPAFASTH